MSKEKNKRNSVGNKLRFEVFKRDSFKCQYCGRAAPEIVLVVDHLKPVSKGGDSDISNLITSCFQCNSGKGKTELSDDSAISKQREQLEQLNERRLQLEMMLEWRQGLLELGERSRDALSDAIATACGHNLTDSGLEIIDRWLRSYGLQELLDACESAKRYLIRDEENEITIDSAAKFFEYIPRIASVNRRSQKKPYLPNLYYIRGILRKRLAYVNDWQTIQMLEAAVNAGVDIDDLKEIAIHTRTWTTFRTEISEAIDGADPADQA